MDELETEFPSDGDDGDTFDDSHSMFWEDTAGDDEDEEETPEKHSQVLTTLVPSPVIKDIFEANLRSPGSQDIIFIKVSAPLIYALTVRAIRLSCIA